MGLDNSMTLDAYMWNGSVGELSLCVINIESCIIRNIFETNLPVDLSVVYFFVPMYMLILLMYCDLHA